jgi:hypothetical protein
MGLIAGLGMGKGAIPALGGVSRDLVRTFGPEFARTLADAVNRMPVPEPGALPPARPGSGYDRLIDAINRLPRPFMAFGSQALVLYALVDPEGFAARMAGLDAMPEALWWLLGAIITAYFGAREAHHMRHRAAAPPAGPSAGIPAKAPESPVTEPNPALDDWRDHG